MLLILKLSEVYFKEAPKSFIREVCQKCLQASVSEMALSATSFIRNQIKMESLPRKKISVGPFLLASMSPWILLEHLCQGIVQPNDGQRSSLPLGNYNWNLLRT